MENLQNAIKIPLTACKQYCLAAGVTQGNIAYMQTVSGQFKTTTSKQGKIVSLPKFSSKYLS